MEAARAFLRGHHRAVLVTRRADGTIQTSPVLAGLDAEGFAIVSSSERTAKVRNLRRDPRASLCVMNDRFFGDWVQIDGRAQVIGLPDALEPLVDYYRRVAGEHPDWADYRAAMEREKRCLIRIGIERSSSG